MFAPQSRIPSKNFLIYFTRVLLVAFFFNLFPFHSAQALFFKKKKKEEAQAVCQDSFCNPDCIVTYQGPCDYHYAQNRAHEAHAPRSAIMLSTKKYSRAETVVAKPQTSAEPQNSDKTKNISSQQPTEKPELDIELQDSADTDLSSDNGTYKELTTAEKTVGKSFFEDVDIDLESISKEAFDVTDLLPKTYKNLDDFHVVDPTSPVITLDEAIFLALRDNEDIETAYLNRQKQIQDLRATENSYRPNGSITVGSSYSQTHSRDAVQTSSISLPSPDLTLTQKLKTGEGASISFGWNNGYTFSKTNGVPGTTSASTDLSLSFSQPLLKGFGYELGRLSLTRAYLQQESDVLNLKKTVIKTITDVITLYRAYVQALKQFEIDKNNLRRARGQLERTQALIEAGREPRTSIYERGRSVARAEFDFQGKVNSVDQARINLARSMNIDTDFMFLPEKIESVDVDPEILPTVDEAVQIAYLNDTSYHTELISLRNTELNYMKAKNDTLWDLKLSGGISTNAPPGSPSSLGNSNEKAWDFRDRTVTGGLTLTIPINDSSRETGLISAKIDLRNQKINLRKTEQNLRKNIKDAIRNIDSAILQLRSAKLETALAKLRLEAKKYELDAGKATQLDYSDAQDKVLQSETSELQTAISLLNLLNNFDQTLGTTLKTWGIDINNRTAKMPKLEDTLFYYVKDENKPEDPNPCGKTNNSI